MKNTTDCTQTRTHTTSPRPSSHTPPTQGNQATEFFSRWIELKEAKIGAEAKIAAKARVALKAEAVAMGATQAEE
jgi:hypothetical protein